MGNALGIKLEGKVVVLKKELFRKGYDFVSDRLFSVTGGFGSSPVTSGTALFGKLLSIGKDCRFEGYEVERLATEEEIAAAERKGPQS